MAQKERVSVRGIIFVGKLQQLAITQTYFDPVITILKRALICRLNVQENSLRSAAAGCNIFPTRHDEILEQLEVIIGKNIGQKHGCGAVGTSRLCQGHEHTSLYRTRFRGRSHRQVARALYGSQKVIIQLS